MVRDTDRDWETWGKHNPYFGVCSQERYRQDQMTEESREEFFRSGEDDVESWLAYARRHIDPDFRPRRILDFGCGVGRLLIAAAKVGDEATGVDVSESMLAEARRNCDERGLTNVKLHRSDDRLSLVEGTFDFIYSHIVLQHIPVERGTEIFRRLVELLAPGGIAYLQLTYAHENCPETLGVPPPSMRHGVPQASGPVRFAKRVVKTLLGRAEKERREPPMLMNAYSLNQVLFILQRTGVSDVHVTFTNHGGIYGAALYFRKPAD